MDISKQILPSALIAVLTLTLFFLERRFPGRKLPPAKGWYIRALLLNLIQVSTMGLAGLTWNRWFRMHSFLHASDWGAPVLQGFAYWYLGTFIFYWWHRLRHYGIFWRLFHQIHHSPSRIEILTSFYKHPVEIAANSILIGFVIYTVFGSTAEAGAWYAFFAASGEYFYHCNLRTPRWLGYLIQRPEHHSIHHQLDVHNYNFGDITLWDRIFGTFRDTDQFAPRCGFPADHENKFGQMLVFQDVY